MAKPLLLLPYNFCWHIIDVQIHRRILGVSLNYYYHWSHTANMPIPGGNEYCLGNIEYLCPNRRHGLLICANAMAFAHVGYKFRHRSALYPRVCWSDTGCQLLAQLQRPLQGISWHIIKVQVQLKSAIQFSTRFLEWYEVIKDKLWLIMEVVIQPKHASWRTN